ncbi:nickel-dependent lactate racemase [Desulforamulus ruminis]|uniref:nickel-dependent lactate racemase n=1 Tax=Desulforamulus ruminis TaxID=1564 RepID=UPI002FDB41FC
MKLVFNYGKESLGLNIQDQHIVDIVRASMPAAGHAEWEIMRALNEPLGCPSLTTLIRQKNPKKVVLVVTDISRPVPQQWALPPLLEQIHEAGLKREQLTFVIATGAHRPNTPEETRESFGDMVDCYRFINHNCDSNLVSMGFLQDGSELLVNEKVAEADMIVTVGAVMPHNLAGFSGGPKLICPGVAGRKTIQANHSMMEKQGVGPGKTSGNPIQEQFWQAAEQVGVDFAVNLVLNYENSILKAFAGNPKRSWQEACVYCRKVYRLPLPEPASVVLAGAGGYPRDMNLYQSVKALINAARLVRPGGTVVLVAQCRDGMGEPLFQKWMQEAQKPEDVLERFKQQGFSLGPHKAFMICRVLKKIEVVLISDLAQSKIQGPLLKAVTHWEQAEREIIKRHGSNYRMVILPQAELVFPL